MLAEASLSFLGLGPGASAPWGALLDQGTAHLLRTPRLAMLAGALIAATVLGFNLNGDWLRDRLDPRAVCSPPENRVFYRYSQNNSNGVWDGPQYLFVEAASPEEAEARALEAGVYFDGVAAERDCVCCGDRWFRTTDAFATRDEALASLDPEQRAAGEGDMYRFVGGATP